DLIALYYVGMWQALTARHPNRATSTTVARVLVLPWLLFLLICLILPFLGGRIQEPARFLLGLWFILGLGADLLFGTWARFKLLSEFRVVAAHRTSPRPGLLKRLFSDDQRVAPAQLQPVGTER